MDNVFEARTHYEYLNARLDPRRSPRGIKTRFSEHLRILPAYLSQVLKEKYALSLEQADLANQFFDHSEEEAEFFLLLTSRDRAGTHSLRVIYQKKIDALIEKRKLVVARLGQKSKISSEAQAVYYSSWIYPAVHVACTIGHLRTRKAIADYLGAPPELVSKALDFLEKNSLLSKKLDVYTPTENWIRLGKESPHIIRHHTNWRLKAIEDLEVQTDDDLHYSGVFSIDAETAARVKDEFLDFLKKQLKTMEGSPETELVVIGVDFFRPFKKPANPAK